MSITYFPWNLFIPCSRYFYLLSGTFTLNIFKMLHFSFKSKKCFLNIIITDIGVLYYDHCCFFEGMLLGKTFLWHGETGEDLLSAIKCMFSWIYYWRFSTRKKPFIVCSQKRTDRKCSNRRQFYCLLFICLVLTYIRAKVFQTYPHLPHPLK